ncbi:MAG: DNA adenine methylase [Alphaproteobacteria bacterium]
MRTAALKKSDLDTKPLAKPVLKWAGGKTQLLPTLSRYYPKELGSSIRKYIEPFFGGGAVFFDLYNSGLIDEAILVDSNAELIVLYRTIKEQPHQIIEALSKLQKKNAAMNEQERELFFYETRENFNLNRKEKYARPDPLRAAQIVFLNRTCFNGLFRVNSKQHFNVPHGHYKNPRILDEVNIHAVSAAFQIADIVHGDFNAVSKVATNQHFVYFDPPYKPLSKTSSFTAYSGLFDDNHQMRLAEAFKALDSKGVCQMLSNSDPFTASGDDFFDRLYDGFNINRVEARRMINSNATKRGEISELLITNYDQN